VIHQGVLGVTSLRNSGRALGGGMGSSVKIAPGAGASRCGIRAGAGPRTARVHRSPGPVGEDEDTAIADAAPACPQRCFSRLGQTLPGALATSAIEGTSLFVLFPMISWNTATAALLRMDDETSSASGADRRGRMQCAHTTSLR
jgi:hypothetical protein